jgi:hypothetical protein
MKFTFGLRLGAAIALVCLAAAAAAQYTTVTGSHVGGSATPLANGMIYLQPVSGCTSNPDPVAARIAADQGQILGVPYKGAVLNGAFSISNVPDALATSPNIAYAVTALDPFKTVVLGNGLMRDGVHVLPGGPYGCVQLTGTTWNFDTYVPSTIPTILPATGGAVNGPMTFNGPVSFASTVSGINVNGLPAGVAGDGANGLQVTGNVAAASGQFSGLVTAPRVEANGQMLGGRPLGSHFFGDSITFGNGSTSSWPGFAQNSLAYAFRMGRMFGGVPTNDAVGGAQVLDQAVMMSQAIIPQINGPVNSLMINTNDAGLYAGDANKQLVTKRVDTFTHNYLAIPASSYVPAQGCTKSGSWTNDDTYGVGRGIYSTTNGNTLSCSATPPPSSPGVVLACYVIANANSTSTFTLAIDGVQQTDYFASGTTWHGNGDNGVSITANGGSTAGPVCARFSGLSTGVAHTFLWTVTGTTGATAKVEPLMLMVVPAKDANNPNEIIYGFPIPSSAATNNYTYNAAYYAITQSIAAQAIADGLNVTWVDTQAAEATNQAVLIPMAAASTVVPGGTSGWVSDIGVSYYLSGVPLAKVASAPACGQYSVSGGIYTFNSCDSGRPVSFSFMANCGAGVSNAAYASNCLTDTLHPSNLGHAVIVAAAKAALASSQLLFPGAPAEAPFVATPITPKEWATDNQWGVNSATAWNPGRAVLKFRNMVWGYSFEPGLGTIWISPTGSNTAWCGYSGASIPKDMTTLACNAWVNGGGHFYENSGIDVQPASAATASVNQSGAGVNFTANTWYSTTSASAVDTYTLANSASNGTQNTHLKLSHALNACAAPPCTWDLDISGATGVNKLGTAATGPNSVLQGQAIQAGTVAAGSLQNFIQNSVNMTGTGWSAGSATVTGGQADPLGGTNAISMQSASSSGTYVNTPTVQNLVNGTTYSTCGYLKGAAGGEQVQVLMGGFGSGASIPALTTSWQYYGPYTWAPNSLLTRTFAIQAIPATNQTVYAYGWSVVPGTMCPAFLPTTTPVTTPVQGIVTPAVIAPLIQTSIVYTAAVIPLPACNAAALGQRAVVGDATSPSYLGAYASGGAVVAPVICNGSGWVTY